MEKLLEIKNLCIHFDSRDGCVNAVCKVNMDIHCGQIIGLIGETGCGKSVLGQSVLKLLPKNACITGKILFEGKNILKMSDKELRAVRGHKIAFICQNPAEALNPLMKNGTQIMESVRINQALSKKECCETSIDLLSVLGFSEPKAIMHQYPHELSGGMKQRVLAAMGMSGYPSLLIADEPTKGLDAIKRGQVISTIRKFTETTGSAVLIITHDLKFASAICDTIAVMYAGEIVETGVVETLFNDPKHPYLLALIKSQPCEGLNVLNGTVCSLIDLPSNCRFFDRCSYATGVCQDQHPDLLTLNKEHRVRCLKYV
jgi:peptide/nickel transport system ATP-binding protein